MIIKLKTQHGRWPVGSLHTVRHIIPHGGHSDDALQYVLTQDETHVLESNAEVIVAFPEPEVRHAVPR